ncbi:MFS transporter [Streptomyces incarnatus]|uniref:MFS transporter n=1 Tax=unclassified Streptomyces TaxID=2593676 RepID=UPI0011AA0EBB|nr:MULTISPECIES: MFS transporter [Streptomyces]QHC31922.1 MFS transporter [Streptomyces sp. HF10]WKE69089.1 MFS transporter [Streptomyces sp. WP-1]
MTQELTPDIAAEGRERTASDGAAAPSSGALAVVLIGTFITVLDFFIANVAVPAIKSDLHATAAQAQLIIVGYGVAFTSGLITGGRLGDLYGRRRLFALGMVLFMITSAACSFAPTVTFLGVARILQGGSAALMVPQVLGIISTVYTGAARDRAFTVYGLVIGLAGVFGQFIGGALISVDVAGLSWRTIFLINVPLCLVSLAMTRRTIPESRGQGGTRLDLLGALLITVALGLIVFALLEGQERHWPAWVWESLAVAAVLLAVTVWHLRRRSAAGRGPLIEPGMFRSRLFSVGLLATVAYFLAMGSFFFTLALYLQLGRGMSPLESGSMFLALGVGYFGASIVSARFAASVNARRVAAGPLILAIGYTAIALTARDLKLDGSALWLLPMLLVAGLGMGLTTGPLTNLVLGGAVPEHAAAASGLLNTAQEGGAAVGVAIAGAVFFPALARAGGKADAYPHAFTVTLIPLVCLGLLASLLVLSAPGRTARS